MPPLAAALDKGRAVRERRQQLVHQAAQGDRTAIFRLDSIAADIARIAARLDASAQEAADGGQHTSHAALAGQLLRSVEVRSRIGGHDKPAPSGNEGQPFSVNILFSTGEKVSISTAPESRDNRLIEAEPGADDLETLEGLPEHGLSGTT